MILVSSPFTRSLASRPRLLALYDGDCGICTRSAHWLARIDRRHRLDVRPLQAIGADAGAVPPPEELLRALHVRASDGVWHRGGDAVLTAVEALPGGACIGRLVRRTALRRLVEPAYRLVANHRRLASRLLGVEACPMPDRGA